MFVCCCFFCLFFFFFFLFCWGGGNGLFSSREEIHLFSTHMLENTHWGKLFRFGQKYFSEKEKKHSTPPPEYPMVQCSV